jgi:phosphohistidine phosphatase
MRLYLIRHAHAVDPGENPQRPLSHRGREQVAQLVTFFRANSALRQVTDIWHSPLLRARETALLLSTGLRLTARISEAPGLQPEDPVAPVAERIVAFAASDLVLVGHEPHLSALATLLVTGEERTALFDFKKAGVLALTSTDGTWNVAWQIVPALLGPDPGGAA